ncbi:MAG: hypothetical protein ACXWT2_08015 [Methylovulum sp.]
MPYEKKPTDPEVLAKLRAERLALKSKQKSEFQSKPAPKPKISIQVTKEKSLPQAIGLNLFLPGLGYMYMGKPIVGVLIGLLMIGALLACGPLLAIPAWFSINILMTIDMLILSKRNKVKIIAETTKKCPSCAELIKKEAKVCRFCNLEQN